MTFPLEFDLLMIRVCTFKKKRRKKNGKKKETKKKNKKKDKKKKTKKKKNEKKKECKDMFVSHILLPRFFFFVVGFIIGGPHIDFKKRKEKYKIFNK